MIYANCTFSCETGGHQEMQFIPFSKAKNFITVVTGFCVYEALVYMCVFVCDPKP